MSTSTAPPPVFNGHSAVPAEVLRETDFLQNLLQIREDVLASKHARIRLPSKVIEQFAPRLPQPISLSRPASNGTPNGLSSQSFPPQNPTQLLPTPSDFPAHTQRPFSAKSTSSIDPVLLTKSEHLIRAELQLKRQQVERLLKDQFDKKGRVNDAEEREALINVDEYLSEAHLRVPPVSGLSSTTNNSDGAESFDENSYYSSKADSWSSEEIDPNHGTNPDVAGSLTAPAHAKQPVHKQTLRQKPAESRPNEPTVIDLDEEAYEPADDIEIYESESALMHGDIEEEDYSPPPAEIGTSEPLQGRTRNRGNVNHGGANGSSRRQSPNGPVPSIQNPRKRRREGGKGRQQPTKRIVRSPEPYIKEEPQSPPSLPAYAEPQPSKRPALQPAFSNDLEMVSPRGGSTLQSALYPSERSSRQYRDFDEPSSPTFIHMPQRKVQRDDRDLRRVATLQYARRPYSPGGDELMPAPEPRPSRAVSHAFIDRHEQPVYREASSRPSGNPRYTPTHEYVPRQQSPPPMAPPPRRIVVDQYGNKYYAAPVEQRQSVAPSSRRLEADPFYERAITQEPTVRPLARTEVYFEDKERRMPPPPRRFVETSDVEMIDSPSYRPREVSRRPVEVEYRQVSQYEEMGPPREYVPSRAYSMRPEVVRQDIPEGYIRHESMQPGSVRMSQPRYREVSIVHQEPFDDRRYVSAPQGRRYVEEGPLEGGQEPYSMEQRRMYARY